MQKIARIAVHASQRPQPHRIGFVAQRHARKSHKDAQPASLSQPCVVDLRFLETMGIFANQILNAVARIRAWKQSRFVHICNFIAFLPRIIYSVPFFDGIRFLEYFL